ncbi:MAG: MotA/TolQ/ExbB proton channel family protein [Chthoniobacterales bacterium]
MGEALPGAVDFFVRGGFFMLVLLLLSIGAGTVILLRAFALRERLIVPPGLEDAIERVQPGDSLDGLRRATKLHPSPLGRIVSVCLDHLNWPRQENIEAVQVRARHEVVRMENGLAVLEMTTGVAPLLGLLGTLSGLVSVFANLGGGGAGDPVAVARGISEALNTTIVGLSVAAPSLVAHNYFQRKIETMAVSMEGLVTDLQAKCYPEHR